MRKLIYLPQVRHDLFDAASYYEGFSPDRGGRRFDDAFKVALGKVRDGFIRHARAFEHYHRVPLGRFPYNLYYRLREDRAVIVGVLYSRFNPARIEATLKSREP